MPDFQGSDEIRLQPWDSDVPYGFSFPACSGSDENDGAIPYGTTIATAAVKGYKDNKVEDASMVGTKTVLDEKVVVPLSYPANGPGNFFLEFVLTLSSGATMEFNFGTMDDPRIKASDL